METNFIHKNAKLGTNVKVGMFSYIDDNVEIGDNTFIYPNVTILAGTKIGANCKVFPGAVLGAQPQDISYNNEDTIAIIGDNTTIREFVTVNRGTKASGKTVVGSNCLLMAYVHVAHDCVVGNNCILSNAVNLAGHVTVEDWVIIGGLNGVHQFITIGKHSMIGGSTGLRMDVPPYVKVAKAENSYVGVNSIGLKRRGYSDDDILMIHNIYKKLFVQHTNISKAVEDIKANIPDSIYKDEILDFVANSKRGLIKGLRKK
ncbi:MAG: acyl-ACP--UDP-N-acetylglucosamine O-acyltransferase [Saprospiraceae bacterium]